MRPAKLFLDGNIRNSSAVNLHEDDEFSPLRCSEAPGFLLPEDQLDIKSYQRPNAQNISSFEYRKIPPHLSLCYEELTRHYSAVNAGKEVPAQVELDSNLAEYDPDEDVPPHAILKNYQPGYAQWQSTFRFAPKNTRHVFHGYIHSDTNFLIRFNQIAMKFKVFEPLFGTACLYTFIKDDFVCISESFYFDATPEDVRYHYRQLYQPLISEESRRISFRGSSKIVADASGHAQPHFNIFCATIPEQLRYHDVYLVVNVNKILSCDSDKAVLPYYSKVAVPDLQEHRESCERLSKFRQPVGVSILKITDGRRQETLPVYAQKNCYSEAALAQLVRSLYPLEGAGSSRNDQLDLELKISIFDVGNTDSMHERMKDLGLIRTIPQSPASPKIDAFKSTVLFLPAQIPSRESPLVPAEDPSNSDIFHSKSTSLIIRKVLPLIPESFPWAKSVVRQMRTNMDNTMYLYLQQLDKFPPGFRNLSVKLELVEWSRHPKETSPSAQSNCTVLPNIYNSGPLIGENFQSSVFSRVSYHTKNPSTLDEFKLRLPDVLTERHWIRLTVLHVHVKPQAKRSNILQTIIRSNVEKENIDATEIGVGFLQILPGGVALIENKEHTVSIRGLGETPGADIPFVKVRVNCVCALVSSSPQIQRVFVGCPVNLGYMPSSIVPMDVAAKINAASAAAAAAKEGREATLTALLRDLTSAKPIELSRHFLVLVRILLRAMVSGTGMYDANYVNPFRHETARCQSFLTLLQLVDKVFGSSSASTVSQTIETHIEKDVLEAYIDYLFDEEMPLPGEFLVSMEDVYVDHDIVQEDCNPSPPGRSKTTSVEADISLVFSEENALRRISSRRRQISNEDGAASIDLSIYEERSSSSPMPIEGPQNSSGDANSSEDMPAEDFGSERGSFTGDYSQRQTSRPSTMKSKVSVRAESRSEANFLAEDADDIPVVLDIDLPDEDDAFNRDSDMFLFSPNKQESEMESNIKRMSWGNFITDSHWASGMLLPLQEVPLEELGEHSPREDNPATWSMRYLDEILLHCVSQAQRIIEERLVNLAVYELTQLFLQEEVEEEGGMSVNVLAGKRYRYTGKYQNGLPELPFAFEKSWFDALDKGFITDESDLIFNEEKTRKKLMHKLIGMRPTTRTIMPIQPLNPLYDTLEGHRQRCPSEDAYSVSLRWWPWLHETLSFQWSTLLAIFLESSKKVSPNNLNTILGSYPFTAEVMERPMPDPKSLRVLLMEHGPLLLRMIFKSLCLRIHRELKRAPVMLDDQFLLTLENLVMLLTTESFLLRSGLPRSQKMISSLSHFLRSLFCVIAPIQVIRLIRSSLKAVRHCGTSNEVELRLLMLEEFMQFEFFVAVNFPYTLDAPISLFSSVVESLLPTPCEAAIFTSCGIRYASSPAPNTFAHTMVAEITLSLRQDTKREQAWAILRDLLVRHCFDARFQSREAQQRIACMYLPLMRQIIEDAELLVDLSYDSMERREVLVILLYLFSGTPDHVLRHHIRMFAALFPEEEDQEKDSEREARAPRSPAKSKSPRVISLKRDRLQGRDVDVESYIPRGETKRNQVKNLVLALHMMLDTFEAPVDGAERSDDLAKALLSPAVSCESATESDMYAAPSMRKSSPSEASLPQLGAAKNRKLEDLDARLQSRRTTTSSTRKSVAPPSTSAEVRRWFQRTHNASKPKAKTVAMRPVSLATVRKCGESLSSSAVQVVLRVLWIMFEECPAVYDQSKSCESSFVLRDLNIDESLLTGIENLRIVVFMRMTLTVLLHALYGNQSARNLSDLYLCADAVVRQFGARIFLAAVEDALQYWLRITLFHFASSFKEVRESACNFFLCLARASYHYLGSFTLISTTVLAVVDDVIAEVLDVHRKSVNTFSDEDRVLQRLHESIDEMRAMVKAQLDKQRATAFGERSSPFGASLMSFLNDLTAILLANAELRRYVSHPVGYDFKGSNLLDGPFDERTSNLIQAARKKRKDVKNDNDNDVAMSRSGFHIEEVMMHFVRAADIYDTFKLPRFRMHWLENLARLHEIRSNRAEAAEIRWRIFLLCQKVEKVWQQLWVPRPPLAWRYRGASTQELLAEMSMFSKVGDDRFVDSNRNFFGVFVKAIDMKQTRPWNDVQQYWTHMETALAVVTERYCSVSLIQLAERSSSSLLELYRLNKRYDAMTQEYSRMSQAIRATNEKGITPAIAMGTFYRVSYAGLGAPEYLRDKEFIFRNANSLHVSEFHLLVMNHVRSIVREGVEVKLIHDVNGTQNFKDENIAYIIMNSVKLVMTQYAKSSQYRLIAGGQYGTARPSSLPRNSLANFRVEDMNQASVFQYSQPFTQDGSRAHAKRMDEQWMKTTILMVKEPFPYILTRQQVASREVRILSPIEVAIQDIDDRIESMEQEVDSLVSKPSDWNNLMRIIQGSVMPQVNAGAAEVAKVFLSRGKLVSMQVKLEEMKAVPDADTPEGKQRIYYAEEEIRRFGELAMKLKITLLNFLELSKLLLLKTRKLFVPDVSLLDANSVLSELPPSSLPAHFNEHVSFRSSATSQSTEKTNVNASASTASVPIVYTATELINIKWQGEMERGFKTLIESIFPFVEDLREADLFMINRSQCNIHAGCNA